MNETIEEVTPHIKSLHIPFLDIDSGNETEIQSFLNNLPKQKLKQSNWLIAEKKPQVSFSIGHCPKALLLKFNINEPYFRATYLNANDPVSQDSCVELFISFDDRKHYYNLEFNALGTCLAAYGSNRTNRKRLPIELIKQINIWQKWEHNAAEENSYQWEITFSIPFSVFAHDEIKSLKGRTIHGNFYKCGDALPESHYLVWNPVATILPDFHQPKYFGLLHFD